MKLKNLFILLLMFFGIDCIPQSKVCGCGTKSAGKTIEFSIVSDGSDCCSGLVLANSGYAFTWEHEGHGVYTLTGTYTYSNANQAQSDCCESV
ncbi:hypothetical protein [Flavobacterium litorale]|uniref:Uncharacterized protein n=1 Tax=Flavobacterium litorale TaxID=2856519 RepID=A0ABX8V9W0_9FLAO|nr:hypothetical protein [Flavobacterium litorale]QYJ67978.1 hypothetical protein K1I41_10625 [Flavobacterium litorale]